ncbi:MAG: hypothetical protein AB7G93_11215 [Bdellovibrionales bacterium]
MWMLQAVLMCMSVAIVMTGAPLLHADDPIEGRFENAFARAKRKVIPFKLAKVEAYNREAASRGQPTIPYKAYRLNVDSLIEGLDFVFENLDEAQFHVVRDLYGGFSHTEPKSGRHNYSLVDFMPPTVQALNGHVFKYASTRVDEINEGRSGGYRTDDPNGKIDAHVNTSINCWGTVYGILRSESFSNPRAVPSTFNVFYTGRFQAYDFFSQLGDGVDKPNAQLGDLIMVMVERQLMRELELSARGDVISSTPGEKRVFLEHAMTYIDEGLVFEKSNGGSFDPFRFMTIDEAIAPYTSVAPTSLSFRRVSGPLPKPVEVFGGNAYAIDERWRRPIPDYLQEIFLMGKEILFPRENEYYNTWSQTVDVTVVYDPTTGRYKLGPDAYNPETFDARRNARRQRELWLGRKRAI